MRTGAGMGQVSHRRQRGGAAAAGRGSAVSAPVSAPVQRRSSVPLRRPRPAGLPRGRPPPWIGAEAPRRHPRRWLVEGCSVVGQRRSGSESGARTSRRERRLPAKCGFLRTCAGMCGEGIRDCNLSVRMQKSGSAYSRRQLLGPGRESVGVRVALRLCQ